MTSNTGAQLPEPRQLGGEEGDSMRAKLTLQPAASSPHRARHFTADVLRRWGISETQTTVMESAILLVSELVTNAVLHAQSEVEIVIHRSEPNSSPQLEKNLSVIRIEVRDHSMIQPQVQQAPATATHGRGLALVQALAYRWGVKASDNDKRVWFELLA